MKNMTIKQLKEVATQKGLTFKSSIKKDELIQLLKGAEPVAKTGKSLQGEY